MAVQYVQGSRPLGSLGSIAQIAGMAMGVPWVSALGMGMNAADGLINGGGYTTPGFQNSSSKYQDWILGGLTGSNIAENPDAKARKGKLS